MLHLLKMLQKQIVLEFLVRCVTGQLCGINGGFSCLKEQAGRLYVVFELEVEKYWLKILSMH